MFHVGQKVVCVDDSSRGDPSPSGLCKGTVYTVVDVFVFGNRQGLLVAEARVPDPFIAFHANRFRPVRETDISIFTAMLNKAPAKTTALTSSD